MSDRLTELLLEDRERQRERERARRAARQKSDPPLDPYPITKWRVVAGGEPAYLPKTSMRIGQAGFFIFCKACGTAFESKGLAYCASCMEIPAEKRREIAPVAIGRLCQGPRCENFVPRNARADVRYCSKACRDKAYRARQRDG